MDACCDRNCAASCSSHQSCSCMQQTLSIPRATATIQHTHCSSVDELGIVGTSCLCQSQNQTASKSHKSIICWQCTLYRCRLLYKEENTWCTPCCPPARHPPHVCTATRPSPLTPPRLPHSSQLAQQHSLQALPLLTIDWPAEQCTARVTCRVNLAQSTVWVPPGTASSPPTSTLGHHTRGTSCATNNMGHRARLPKHSPKQHRRTALECCWHNVWDDTPRSWPPF